MARDHYEGVIGLEIHVELKTHSKLFCNCSTSISEAPNTHVCPVCLGLPGSLPVMNSKALEYGILTAIALHCDITSKIQFERKNYYYPDLPKNYQISQLRRNLGTNGHVTIIVSGDDKRIAIDNIHLEEDAGKSLHRGDASSGYSLIDLNRAGTPLIEIVTKPDLRSSDEALQFMNKLKLMLEYLDVSDCNMHEGKLRFEANVSVREKDSNAYGPRVEVKNLNSMKFVASCIDYEINRQTGLLFENKPIVQETRLWDENTGVTKPMRSKEDAHDYRYFPDPDLPEIEITASQLELLNMNFPELPKQREARFFREYNLSPHDIEILVSDKYLSDYFEATVKSSNDPQLTSHWVQTEILRYVKGGKYTLKDFPVKPHRLAEILCMVKDGIITTNIAKEVLRDVLENDIEPVDVVNRNNLSQITNRMLLEKIVDEVISKNVDVYTELKSGKNNLLAYLIGQVMKSTQGKANPQVVNEIIKEKVRPTL